MHRVEDEHVMLFSAPTAGTATADQVVPASVDRQTAPVLVDANGVPTAMQTVAVGHAIALAKPLTGVVARRHVLPPSFDTRVVVIPEPTATQRLDEAHATLDDEPPDTTRNVDGEVADALPDGGT